MPKLRQAIIAAFILAVLLCALPTYAEGSEALLHRIQQNLSTVRSIACRFEQEIHSPLLEGVQKSIGHFHFSRPDKISWEFEAPLKKGFSVNGNQGKKWTDSREYAESFALQNEPVFQALFQQIKLLCTFDLNLIKEQYSIEILSVAPVVIGLTPLADPYGHEIKQLVVRLAEDQKSIAALELLQNDGSSKVTRFLDIRLNQPIASHIFD